VELDEVLKRRRMVRSFRAEAIDPALVSRLVHGALDSPTAGNTRGVSWVVLLGPAETEAYWDATTTASWRAASTRWPGLSRAPVVALALTSPRTYLARYREPDKASSALGPASAGGRGEDAWPVPYWFGDAAFSVLTLLLEATAAGLGACFLGNFRGERALLDALGVPSDWRLFGTVLLGHPDGSDHRSASLDRTPDEGSGSVYRGRWGAPG
jgi:nitroreductase